MESANFLIGLLVFNLNVFTIAENVEWNAFFGSYHPFMVMRESRVFNVKIEGLNKKELIESAASIQIVSDSNILEVSKEIGLDEIEGSGNWNGTFEAKVFYIGRVNIFVEIHRENHDVEKSINKITLNTIRKPTLNSDYIETFHVYKFGFYMFLRLLCGTAIDWTHVWRIIRKPVSPGISAFCYFILTPMVSHQKLWLLNFRSIKLFSFR